MNVCVDPQFPLSSQKARSHFKSWAHTGSHSNLRPQLLIMHLSCIWKCIKLHFFHTIAETHLPLPLSLSRAEDAIRELEFPPPLLLSPLLSLCPCTKVKHTITAFTPRLKLDLPIICRIRIGLQSLELQMGNVRGTCHRRQCLQRGISLLTPDDWC